MIYLALIAAVVVLLVLFGIVMLAPSVTPATTAQDWPEPIAVATVDTSEIQLGAVRLVTREQAFGSALILQRYLVESGYLTEAETLAKLSPAILRGKQSAEEQEK